ncbi:MAG: carboxypeptidase-like regulatory domain-containing protein, partial [Bacteroidota bacterium]
MKQLLIPILLLAVHIQFSFAQNLTQTVRGTIHDIDSNNPLSGVKVIVLNGDQRKGAISNTMGQFRIEQLAVGRISLQLTYPGYEELILPNIVVNSGKEVILNLMMQESAIKLDEVVIRPNENKGEAQNDMALISSLSVSPEQTNRYAGGFNDPSRILSNFAGVTSTQDGSNDIIVRGNAPKYIQWRLEGIQITNPNHFADQSAVGGAISTLNNNLLSTS